MKLKFSRQILEKYSNIKFLENMSSGSRVVSCERMYGHDKANGRLSQFCERAKKIDKFVKYLEYLFIDWHLQISIPCLTQTYF
jgi:hypothetical protein